MTKTVASIVVDSLPYPLMPVYDWTTGLLFLCSRGNLTSCYEVHAINPYLIPVGRTVSQTNHSAMAIAPKRVCDVMRFEVARFFALTVCGTIEPTSFIVPRKDSLGAVFHEDLYPPVPSGEPSTDSATWFGPEPVLTKPHLKSLRPEGAKSIFDISAAEGGRSREIEEHRIAAVGAQVLVDNFEASAPPVSEGRIGFAELGMPVVKRWVSLTPNRVYVFEDEESPTSLVWFDATDITSVFSDEEGSSSPCQFTVIAEGNVFTFVADDEAVMRNWMRSIQSISASSKKTAAQLAAGSLAPVPQKTLLVISPSNATRSHRGTMSPVPGSPASSPKPCRSPVPGNIEPTIESVLYELVPTGTLSVAKQFKFSIVNSVLYRQEIPSPGVTPSLPTEVVHLDRILKACHTEGVFEMEGFSFKILSAPVIVHLLAETEDLRASWVSMLSRLRRQARASGTFAPLIVQRPSSAAASTEGSDVSDPEADEDEDEETALEGSIELAREGQWISTYLTVVSDEMFFFTEKAAPSPFLRIPLSSVESVQASDNSNPAFSTTDFEASITSPDSPTVQLRAASGEERSRWLQGIEEKRKKAVDVLAKLHINEATFRTDPAFVEAHGKTVVKLADVLGGDHKMLLQIVGKRKIRVWNVEVSWRSLNPNNSFLLDAGNTLYLWHGSKSSRITRGKASDLAHRVRVKERSARPSLVTLV
jgi:hypothetical protein